MKHSLVYLSVILVLAAILRLYHLGSNPPAAYGDEISFAWNAWSVLKTGNDEYGVHLPLQFRAFDDYKAPIPVYLLVPFLAVFGLNTFIVRLPVALFGVASVGAIYFLVKKLFEVHPFSISYSSTTKSNLIMAENCALFSALLLAISPWHIHLSRGYFESTIAVFFLLLSIYFFIGAQRKAENFFLSAFFFVCTLYTYFTPRIMLILFIPFLFLWGRSWVLKKRKHPVYFFILLFVLVLPLLKLSFFNQGLSRINKLASSRDEKIASVVTIDRNSTQSPELIRKILHNRLVYWVRDVTYDYLDHFSFDFLFLRGDSSLRYFLGNMGMLYLVEMPFLLIGIYVLFRHLRTIFYLLFGWWVIAAVPAAIAGRPFAVRSLAMLPPILVIIAVGLSFVFQQLALRKNALYPWLPKLSRSFIIAGFAMSVGYYMTRYHLEYPTYAATWWGWENKAAIDLALQDQNKYDHIYISNFYTGAELAFAYYTAMDPNKYLQAKEHPVTVADNRQQIQFGKFNIGSLDLDAKRLHNGVLPPKTLYIGRPEEADSPEIIAAPDDGRALFKIHRTD